MSLCPQSWWWRLPHLWPTADLLLSSAKMFFLSQSLQWRWPSSLFHHSEACIEPWSKRIVFQEKQSFQNCLRCVAEDCLKRILITWNIYLIQDNPSSLSFCSLIKRQIGHKNIFPDKLFHKCWNEMEN